MKFLRVKEAADLLGVKPASIRQLDRRGILKAYRDWSGQRRFDATDIERLRDSTFCREGDR
jgi:excisionase family DNA binding protein